VQKALVIALLILAIVGCDQAAKQAARSSLAGRGTVRVVGDVLVLHYVENEGAFLSLGSRLPAALRMVLLGAVPLAALAAVVIVMLRSKSLSWTLLTGLSLIAGGGFGNLVDRLARGGRVSDFLNLGLGSFRTGIFNLADMAIMAGCILLLVRPSAAPARNRPGPTPAPPPGEDSRHGL
jgi:signal peptidase II